MKTRHIITLLALLACGLQADAQNLWDRFYNGWLIKPRNVDSTYIYQHHLGFNPSLTSNFSQQRVMMTTVLSDETEALLTVIDKMEESLSRRMGAMLGLGRLSAGWSVELTPDSSQKSTTFLFSFRGNKFGFNVNYLAFSQKITETGLWGPTFASFLGEEGYVDTIPNNNHVLRFTIDGYYIFNTRRFAYPPGIAGNMVQLKSAGSWMMAGRYLQSSVDLNPETAVASFGMNQFSLGCGYSYTWVPWSRMPREDGRGMFTFFVNGTVIPMLTFFNHLTITPYESLSEMMGSEKRSVFYWPTPNILANATIGISWSKFYLGAQFNYNVFHFNTRNAISDSSIKIVGDETELNLGIMGVLYEWNLGLKFQVCF